MAGGAAASVAGSVLALLPLADSIMAVETASCFLLEEDASLFLATANVTAKAGTDRLGAFHCLCRQSVAVAGQVDNDVDSTPPRHRNCLLRRLEVFLPSMEGMERLLPSYNWCRFWSANLSTHGKCCWLA